MSTVHHDRIQALCSEFRLPTVCAEVVPRFKAAEHGKALATLLEVFELEAGDRRQRREDRLRRAAKLPAGKTWDSLDATRLPLKLQQQLEELSSGAFLERAVNVLAFGLPGTGKTHAMAGLGHRLIEQGHSVLFAPTYQLVQDLLAAKRDLELPRALRKLDHFEVLILDDLGYLKHRADEADVLFTLIAERYERRSLIVTSNMVFSQWEDIFQSPMATAAAIDRIVHHSVIAEFDVTSYRTAEAQKQGQKNAPPAAQGRRAKKGKIEK
jgi:DNA replication protein DnaC